MATFDVHSFTAFDWFLMAITVCSVLNAFRQGLIKVMFSLSGLIFGVLIATWVHSAVADALQTVGGIDTSAQIMAFLAVVVVVYIGFMLAGGFARRVALGAGMTFADRIMGAGFGLVRGALTGAVVLVALMVVLPRSTVVERSQFAPYVLQGTQAVSFVVPDSFRDVVQQQIGTQPLTQPADANALEARTMKQR